MKFSHSTSRSSFTLTEPPDFPFTLPAISVWRHLSHYLYQTHPTWNNPYLCKDSRWSCLNSANLNCSSLSDFACECCMETSESLPMYTTDWMENLGVLKTEVHLPDLQFLIVYYEYHIFCWLNRWFSKPLMFAQWQQRLLFLSYFAFLPKSLKKSKMRAVLFPLLNLKED